MKKWIFPAFVATGIATIGGCPQPNIESITLGTNTIPRVEAGPDLERTVGDVVSLRANAEDDDGDVLTYQWTLVRGPETNLNSQNGQTLRFTPRQEGEYQFSVRVSDDRSSDQDTVSVFVSPAETSADDPIDEPTPADPFDPADVDPNSIAAPLVESTFDRDHEGWTLSSAGSVEGGWRASGGRPGGNVAGRLRFAGGQWQAPAKFTGDLSAAIGGVFRFDFRHEAHQPTRPVLRIQGVDGDAAVQLATVQGGWTTYAVRLDNSGGWLDANDGLAIETDELALILSDVVAIQILVGGDSTTGLDNVQVVLP